jgi:hypothetical protein
MISHAGRAVLFGIAVLAVVALVVMVARNRGHSRAAAKAVE